MFHVRWNRPISETGALAPTLKQLHACLPPRWSLEVVRGSGSSLKTRSDLAIRVRTSDGISGDVAVHGQERIQAMDVARILTEMRANGSDTPLIVAPFLSARTRERIVELGGNYADNTGNIRLVMDHPAMFIQLQGADRDPAPERRSLTTLRGPAAGRVVRAVCDFRPPFGVRELASRAGTSAASVSRVLELLRRDALIERDARGAVVTADWEKLIRRWTRDHVLATSNRSTAWLAARGLPWVLQRLAGTGGQHAVTGSFAAAKLAPVAAPRLLAVYVDDVQNVADALDLRPAESGANVLLLEPFDKVVFERTINRDGVTLSNPSQVATDLLTGPGRGPAEAEALLTWMKENEDAWRT